MPKDKAERPFPLAPEVRLLNDAELNALFSAEDHGLEQAPMQPFYTLEEFRQGQNNFYLTFSAPIGTIAHDVYRSKLAVQRFQMLQPELFEEIDNQLYGGERLDFTMEQWELLHQGYDAIAQLVDVKDPYVVQNGLVNSAYLCGAVTN